jgi:hypothetical protein
MEEDAVTADIDAGDLPNVDVLVVKAAKIQCPPYLLLEEL